MKILHCAIIGLGRIAWEFHIPAILKHKGFELSAVVDPLQERLDEAQNEFGVTGYLDIDQLFDNEKLDLIIIASPTSFHKDQTILSMKNGCDVLCDKPMAFNLSETNLMIEAMDEYNKKLMVYQPRRCTTEFTSLQAIIGTGLIGQVYMMKGAYSSFSRRHDWQAFSKNGGGMLNNYGAHLIDQMLLLAGSKADRIECELRTIASLGDADDVVKAIIRTENNIIIDIDINMATAFDIQKWHIFGTRGTIILNPESNGWIVKYFEEKDLDNVALEKGLAASNRQYGSGEEIPWQEKKFLFSDFDEIDFYEKSYQYFALNGTPFVPIEETKEVMRILEESRQII